MQTSVSSGTMLLDPRCGQRPFHTCRSKVYIIGLLLWGSVCRDHPALALDTSRAIPVAAHGDEGRGKRERSLMVLSWSCLLTRTANVLSYKFVYAVTRPNPFPCAA